VKALPVAGIDPQGTLRAGSSQVVRTRLRELLSLGERALDPDSATAQHDARIAAKRLRYVLEVAGGCFGEEAARARVATRDIQGLLGEIHDCDVILPSAAGILSLEAVLSSRRRQLFGAFSDRWRAEERAGTWEALEQAL
jgi:CHAD domain-containing protein